MPKGIITKIFSVAAAALLMFPYAVQLEHRHHHHFHHDTDCAEKHVKQNEHEHPCKICSFEYSSFLNDNATPLIFKTLLISSIYIFPKQTHLFSTNPYSFLLRAPPAFV